MKELWTVIIDKIKQLEPQEALIYVGIVGLITLGLSTAIIFKFINMIIEITLGLGGKPLH